MLGIRLSLLGVDGSAALVDVSIIARLHRLPCARPAIILIMPVEETSLAPIEHAPSTPARRPLVLAVALIVFGVIGLIAAFALTLEKLHVLEHPGTKASCDFSLIVQCGANLASWQGSLFGFPNPLIGLVAWSVVVTVGVALLAGARFANWFWIAFNVGVVGALVFVIWLMSQSIFVLATLCPWCMVTWAVVIPLFWMLTLDNLRSGRVPTGAGVRQFAERAYGWIPLITLVCYLIVAIVAQLRLDVLRYLFI